MTAQEPKKPRVQEFIAFHQLLMSNAPDGYEPYYLRLNPGGKDPIEGVSWKSTQGKLTFNQALEYMRFGGNIGLAATANDDLVNVDCDGGHIKAEEVKPTLITRHEAE